VYTDKAVTPGNVYSYSVSTYNLKGGKAFSQDVTVVFDEMPGAPQACEPMSMLRNKSEWTTPPGQPPRRYGFIAVAVTKPMT